MAAEIPIACNLSSQELQQRQRDVLQKLTQSLIEVKEIKNGFNYQFPADDEVLQDLINVIKLERKCCPFLNFKLSVEAGRDFVSFELTGQESTKEMLRSLFNWN